ncbi:hypothetical protein B566_EDAN014513 [Ephemera danica]|nr:hypothetical protein B566_EDAN014513 [Ephemera danica]
MGDSIHLPGSTGTTPAQSPPIPVGVPLNKGVKQQQQEIVVTKSSPEPAPPVLCTLTPSKDVAKPARKPPSPKAVQTEWTQVWDNASKRSKEKKQSKSKERSISVSTSDGSIHVKSKSNQVVPNSSSCHMVTEHHVTPVQAFAVNPEVVDPSLVHTRVHHHHCCAGLGARQRVTSNTCHIL